MPGRRSIANRMASLHVDVGPASIQLATMAIATSPVQSARLRLTRAVLTLLVMGATAVACGERGARLVFDGRSEYNRVRVVEHADGLRSLYLDEGRTRQSSVYPGRPLHLEFEYTRVGMIAAALMPPDGRILFVGLGGGAMPMYLRQILPDARIEAVEIDPLVVEVAHRYFGFVSDERTVVHTGDGRAFVEEPTAGAFDVIVLDAYSDEGIPLALATREFLEHVRARLASGGVVVSNVWTSAPEYASLLATYTAVFPETRLLRVEGHRQRIVLASGGDRALDRGALLAHARELAARAELGFDLVARIEMGYELPPRIEAPVLEDARTATH
jgi:spermidine synthase